MQQFLAEYGVFLAETVTVVVALLVLVTAVAGAAQRMRPPTEGHLEVRKLNERYREMRDAVQAVCEEPKVAKKRRKREAKEEKSRQRAAAQDAATPRKRLFVLRFEGDMRAHAVVSLREEVSAVLAAAAPGDEAVVLLESGGGMVHAYGLAAAQLARIRERGIPLTACVDKVAASGGYLMACVADTIVAAPFALVGSIGVVAQLPNFHRLLRKHDIDYEMLTAGQYKRTLTLFGENTEEGRRKFGEEIEDIHRLFQEYIARYRPALDVPAVATGEAWFGERALGRGLVDRLGTSDALLQAAAGTSDLVEIRFVERKGFAERFGVAVEGTIARGVERALDGLRRGEV